MNVVLIGYRAAGKTSVGSRLANRLRRHFVDTDHLLEGRYGAIGKIVETHGWPYFRALEKTIIEEISNHDHLIIAPGGGSVLDKDNVSALRRNGFLIWLRANARALYERMLNDPRTGTQRPSLTGRGALEEIEEVLASRTPLYERASEAQLDTSSMDVTAVTNQVMSLLERKMGAN